MNSGEAAARGVAAGSSRGEGLDWELGLRAFV